MRSTPRRVNTLGLIVLACGLAFPSSLPAATSDARPNILWVVSEDNTYNFVGAYGDPLAHTPNLDRLAARGVVFDHVYTEPVCAPSRSTIITGCYASSMGTQHMRSLQPLPPGVRFFPEYLREAGYFCTNNGKCDYNTSTTGDDTAPGPIAAATPYHAGSVPGEYPHVWDENGPQAHWRHRQPGQPFFAVFNFFESHESRLFARQPLATDPAKVRVPAYLPDTPAVRTDLAQYYDCVARADAAIGKILDELEADGLADSTIVIYYSDNGGVVTGPKRSLNDQGTHVAMIARFPQRYAHLAPAAAGTHDGELINFVDLAPTMLSLAGVPDPGQFQGRAFAGPSRTPPPAYTFTFADRMDERYNLVRAITDGRYRYIRNYYPERPWGQRLAYQWRLASVHDWWWYFRSGLLDPVQRRFFEAPPAEVLYDCAHDPDNVHNLAADPAQHDRLQQMRAALREQLLRIHDTGFLPEPMMIAQAAGASPTVVTTDPQRYPLARLLDFLDATQLSGTAANDFTIAAAAHDNFPVLRYWAAIAGWRASAAVAPLLEDEDDVVRVAAAESVLRHSDSAPALHVLAAAIGQTARPELRLLALDALARTTRDIPAPLRSTVGELATRNDSAGFAENLPNLARTIVSQLH